MGTSLGELLAATPDFLCCRQHPNHVKHSLFSRPTITCSFRSLLDILQFCHRKEQKSA